MNLYVNFNEKFRGDKKLIRFSCFTTGLLGGGIWVFVVRKQLESVYGKFLRDESAFFQAVLTVPIDIAYLIFYCALFSWLVYVIVRKKYSPEK